MGSFLKIIGFVWALIGFANLFLMPWTTAGEGLLTVGLMVNILLFIFPGLGLYGVGTMMARKST